MKKIFLFAAAAVLAMASCGNKTASDAEAVDSAAVAVENAVEADSAIQSITSLLQSGDQEQFKVALASVQTKYAELAKSGKLEEAKKYASAVQEFVKDNAEKIKEFVKGDAAATSLIDGIAALPIAVEATAEEAVAAVKSDAQSLVDNAKAAVENKVDEEVNAVKEATVNKVNEKVNEVQNKANAKVEEAKAKVNDAANKAVSDAASKLLGK